MNALDTIATGEITAGQAFAFAAKAPNTRRSYLSALKALHGFLHGREVTDGTLAAFILHRSAAGHSHRSTQITLSAVKLFLEADGRESPAGRKTKDALAIAARQAAPQKQAQGIQHNDAAAIASVAANGAGSKTGLRDAAIIAVMSDCLLRISEAAAIDVEHIERQPDGSGTLLIPRSKTDQHADTATLYVGAVTMKRIAAWMDAAGIESGPLFVRIRRGDHPQAGQRVTARAIQGIVKARTAQAQADIAADPNRVSGHSLRVGTAQTLAAAGGGAVEIQNAGRWKSDRMPASYTRNQRAGQGAVARLIYGQGK